MVMCKNAEQNINHRWFEVLNKTKESQINSCRLSPSWKSRTTCRKLADKCSPVERHFIVWQTVFA
jgi:hypothetical protein